MASASSIICSIIVCFFIVSTAGRSVPAGNKSNDKLEKDCISGVGVSMGSVHGAGFVFGVGTGGNGNGVGEGSNGNGNGVGEGSNGNGGIGDFDHSGPAASNGQYIPGNDDTFVPNTGYEVPNPAYVGSSGTTP